MSLYTIAREYFRNFYSLSKIKSKYKLASTISKNQLLPIEFKNEVRPLISIIIPFYNQIEYTKNCLQSIFNNYPESSFEIILINDNSTENIDLSFAKGIRIINNTSNLGFVKSVNKAIQEAHGKYIYLLNNDTIVHKGFLDELLFVFNNFENVGSVGSMLLNSDGSLQEAGSFFLQNGYPTQIANKPIYAPEINYIYQVDYCSGCSLLFEKKQQNGYLNLLDESYAPAYYEDADLCFQFKYNQNKKNYYTPFSKVTHFNGASYNKKNNSKKQNLLEKNHSHFTNKWVKELHAITSVTKWNRIQELYDEKRIIFLHYRIPLPNNNSGELRLTEIIKTYVSLGYHCSIISPTNKIKNKDNELFQRLGINVYYQYKPFFNYYYFFRRLLKDKYYVWFSTSDIFLKYYKLIKKQLSNSILIFDMVDVHHLRYQRALEFDPTNKQYQRRYKKYLEFETTCSQRADITITISEDEKDYMSKFTDKSKLLVISNIHYTKVKLDAIPKFNERKDLLFIGSSHHPNIDAINFLIDEIMPLVWGINPEIKLNIIGDVNKHFKTITDERINFLGFVPDIESYFLENKIMVAPLRYGAGVKGKIGQAFEYYLPVVTSTIGAEGMFLIHETNALLADNVENFANEITKLYDNEHLWSSIQQNVDASLKPFSIENLIQSINKIESIKK